MCGAAVEPGQAVHCTRCATVHHRDCFTYGRGCSTYGCGATTCWDATSGTTGSDVAKAPVVPGTARLRGWSTTTLLLHGAWLAAALAALVLGGGPGRLAVAFMLVGQVLVLGNGFLGRGTEESHEPEAAPGPLALAPRALAPDAPWRPRAVRTSSPPDALLGMARERLRKLEELLPQPAPPPAIAADFLLGPGHARVVGTEPAPVLRLPAVVEQVLIRRDTARAESPASWLVLAEGPAGDAAVVARGASLLTLFRAAWPAAAAAHRRRLLVESTPGTTHRFEATGEFPPAGLERVADYLDLRWAAPEGPPPALALTRPAGPTKAAGSWWRLRHAPDGLEITCAEAPDQPSTVPYEALVHAAEEPGWLHLVAADAQISLPLAPGSSILEDLERTLLEERGRMLGESLFVNLERLARRGPVDLAYLDGCRLELARARLQGLPVLDTLVRILFLDGSLSDLWRDRGAGARLTLRGPGTQDGCRHSFGLGAHESEAAVHGAFERGPLEGTWLLEDEASSGRAAAPAPASALLSAAGADAPGLAEALAAAHADPAARAWLDVEPGCVTCWLRGLDLTDRLLADLARVMAGLLAAAARPVEPPRQLPPAAAPPGLVVERLSSADLSPRLLVLTSLLSRGRVDGSDAAPWPVTSLSLGAPPAPAARSSFGRRFIEVHDPAAVGFDPGPVPGSFCPRERWDEAAPAARKLDGLLAARPALGPALEDAWRRHLWDWWFDVGPDGARALVWPTREPLDPDEVAEVRSLLELLAPAADA